MRVGTFGALHFGCDGQCCFCLGGEHDECVDLGFHDRPGTYLGPDVTNQTWDREGCDVAAHRHSRLVSKEKALPCVSRSPLLELAPEESHEPLALELEVPLFMRARA